MASVDEIDVEIHTLRLRAPIAVGRGIGEVVDLEPQQDGKTVRLHARIAGFRTARLLAANPRRQALLRRVGDDEPVSDPGRREQCEQNPRNDQPKTTRFAHDVWLRRKCGGNKSWPAVSMRVSNSRMKSSRASPAGIGGRMRKVTVPGERLKPCAGQTSPVFERNGRAGEAKVFVERGHARFVIRRRIDFLARCLRGKSRTAARPQSPRAPRAPWL